MVTQLSKPRNTTPSKIERSGLKGSDGGQGEPPRRRRRKPDAAESEILDAAESFLKEHPFREMTVDDIMARTGLSRPSFYEYFRDRHHLVMKLTERLGEWTYSMSERWLGGIEDSVEALKTGTEKLVELYAQRGYLLRALADAAIHDKQVEIAYRKMIAGFIDATAARIRSGIDRGAIKHLNPEEVATALVLMNERFLIEKLGHDPQGEPGLVVETLLTVWSRVLYGS